MNAHLTHQGRADLARSRDAIEADRYPFSPKVRRPNELLATIDQNPGRVVTPYPPSKPAGQPSFMHFRKKCRETGKSVARYGERGDECALRYAWKSANNVLSWFFW